MLLPATPGFTMSGGEPAAPVRIDPRAAAAAAAEICATARQEGPPEVRLLGGYFAFDSPDAALLVSLLPGMIHLRGVERMAVLVRLIAEETRRSGRAATWCSPAWSRC